MIPKNTSKRIVRGFDPIPAAAKTSARGPFDIPTSSTSNSRVAFGGMIPPPAPFLPYANSGGITSFREPPTCIFAIPWSHPVMTLPAPSLNDIVPASNCFPFDCSRPAYFTVTISPGEAAGPLPSTFSLMIKFEELCELSSCEADSCCRNVEDSMR